VSLGAVINNAPEVSIMLPASPSVVILTTALAVLSANSEITAQQSTAKVVTFSEHIAPIIFNNCTSCHRPGEIGPFELTNFRNISKRAKMIRRVTKKRYMPPWNPVEGHGEFLDERRLTSDQIQLIDTWIQTGKQPGDLQQLPAIPSFKNGWRMGKPDLVVSMKDSYPVPASGPDIYRNFVIPLDLSEDKWVVGWELRPGARTVLHHSLVNFDTTGRSRQQDGRDGEVGFRGMSGGSGSLGIWAVGATPHKLPDGLAMKLPKGADILLSSHFHLSGKAEREQTSIGLYFTDTPPTRSLVPLQMPPMWGFAYRIDIPAGQEDYKVKDYAILPADCEAVEISSHAHTVCKDMVAKATLPSGKIIRLFYIDDWDFNWQGGYTYKSAIALPKGTRVDVEFTYDNSSANPDNPNNPPKRIQAGRETKDEMARITLTLVPKSEKDADGLRRKFSRMTRMRGMKSRRLLEHDKNGDGAIDAKEIPAASRHLLRRYDGNKDGKLSAAELESGRRPSRRR
jgi:hypothetical protein